VGQQFPGVLEEDDSVAEQAPSLFGVAGHGSCGLPVLRSWRRAGRLVGADPQWGDHPLVLDSHNDPRIPVGVINGTLRSCTRISDTCKKTGDSLPFSPAGSTERERLTIVKSWRFPHLAR